MYIDDRRNAHTHRQRVIPGSVRAVRLARVVRGFYTRAKGSERRGTQGTMIPDCDEGRGSSVPSDLPGPEKDRAEANEGG